MSEAFVDTASELLTEKLPRLEDRERRMFTEVIQTLHHECFVLRGGAIRSNPIYAFLEKHEDLVSAYLALGGWRLHLDRDLGVGRLFHPEGKGRIHFNKEETTLLLVLRLVYHENRAMASETPEVAVTIGAVREKLHSLLPEASARPFLSRKVMGSRLRRFESFRILSFEGSGQAVDDDTVLLLHPVLEQLVNASSIQETSARLALLHEKAPAAEVPV